MKPVVCAAVLAFALVSAQAAWAFTIDDQGGNNSDGTPRFTDPDDAAMRPNAMSLSSPSVSSSRGSRSDLLDPTRDPARLPPIPRVHGSGRANPASATTAASATTGSDARLDNRKLSAGGGENSQPPISGREEEVIIRRINAVLMLRPSWVRQRTFNTLRVY